MKGIIIIIIVIKALSLSCQLILLQGLSELNTLDLKLILVPLLPTGRRLSNHQQHDTLSNIMPLGGMAECDSAYCDCSSP